MQSFILFVECASTEKLKNVFRNGKKKKNRPKRTKRDFSYFLYITEPLHL